MTNEKKEIYSLLAWIFAGAIIGFTITELMMLIF